MFHYSVISTDVNSISSSKMYLTRSEREKHTGMMYIVIFFKHPFGNNYFFSLALLNSIHVVPQTLYTLVQVFSQALQTMHQTFPQVRLTLCRIRSQTLKTLFNVHQTFSLEQSTLCRLCSQKLQTMHQTFPQERSPLIRVCSQVLTIFCLFPQALSVLL